MIPPVSTHTIESIPLAISNSSRALTHAFGRYLISYGAIASLKFSLSLIPE